MIRLNVQMPQRCDDCFALDDNGDYPTCHITHTSRGYNFNTREKRMPDCPLIEEENETGFQQIQKIMHEIATFAAPDMEGECDNATN